MRLLGCLLAQLWLATSAQAARERAADLQLAVCWVALQYLQGFRG